MLRAGLAPTSGGFRSGEAKSANPSTAHPPLLSSAFVRLWVSPGQARILSSKTAPWSAPVPAWERLQRRLPNAGPIGRDSCSQPGALAMRLVGLARCPVGSQSRSGRASGRSTELTKHIGLQPRPGQPELGRGWHGSYPRQAQSLLVPITGDSGRILAQNSMGDRRCCPGAVSVGGFPLPAGISQKVLAALVRTWGRRSVFRSVAGCTLRWGKQREGCRLGDQVACRRLAGSAAVAGAGSIARRFSNGHFHKPLPLR